MKPTVRTLLKNPGFTLTAVAALALGIGATTAVFSIVNTVLLKPLQIEDADRFVVIANSVVTESGKSDVGEASSPAEFQFWRTLQDVIHDVAAYRTGLVTYSNGSGVIEMSSAHVTAALFQSWHLKVKPGRPFTEAEDQPNGPHVVLISQGCWMRRFAGDPNIIGRKIVLNGDPFTVIGVVGNNPELGTPMEVYLPLQIASNTGDQADLMRVVARLNAGVTIEQARSRLKASAAEYRRKFPNVLGPKDSFTVLTYRQSKVGGSGRLLLVLASAVSLVLLIACANVANLLLARAIGRKREIAIRSAIGAGRGQLIRQMMAESVVLSLAGGLSGLLLGYGGIRALLAVGPVDLPLDGANSNVVSMDWRVLLFALGVSLFTGLIFGLLPAVQASRADLNEVLKEGGSRAGTGTGQQRLRSLLVIGEVSLAVVLLVGSALLIRTFVALYAVDRGYETKNVMVIRAALTDRKYQKTSAVTATVRAGLEAVRSVPGVAAASAACCVPLQDGTYDLNFDIAGRPPSAISNTTVGWATVSPAFFDAFKIPVKRGRAFNDRDSASATPVVIVNERFAKRYWKDGDPLNQRIVIGHSLTEFRNEPARQIVGIVADVHDEGLDAEPRPVMYVPQSQLPDEINALFGSLMPVAWIVRTQSAYPGMRQVVREKLRQSTGLELSEALPMDQVVRNSTGQRRFNMLLMSVFAGSALLLAALGIYGLMAYSVVQRRQEIGIRMALGADGRRVRNMVVKQGMVLAVAGVVIGLAGALGVTKLIESFIFGVTPRDPVVFVAVPLVLSAVAMLAVWLPAHRASRVSPLECLRYE